MADNEDLYGEGEPETQTEQEVPQVDTEGHDKEDKDQDYERLFEFLDTNDDGELSRQELKKFMQLRGFNPTLSEISTYLEEFGEPESGVLSKDEFKDLAEKLTVKLPDPSESLRAALDEFDIDKNGKVTKDEFRQIMQNRGEEPLDDEEIEQLLNELEDDGDGEHVDLEKLGSLLLCNLNMQHEEY